MFKSKLAKTLLVAVLGMSFTLGTATIMADQSTGTATTPVASAGQAQTAAVKKKQPKKKQPAKKQSKKGSKPNIASTCSGCWNG